MAEDKIKANAGTTGCDCHTHRQRLSVIRSGPETQQKLVKQVGPTPTLAQAVTEARPLLGQREQSKYEMMYHHMNDAKHSWDGKD